MEQWWVKLVLGLRCLRSWLQQSVPLGCLRANLRSKMKAKRTQWAGLRSRGLPQAVDKTATAVMLWISSLLQGSDPGETYITKQRKRV
jgi:hypothetical protein